MRMQRVTKESDLPDVGVAISFQVADNKVEAVIIGEGDNAVRITKVSEYSTELKVLRKELPKVKTMYELRARLANGMTIEPTQYDRESEATCACQELLNEGHCAEVVPVQLEYYEDKI